MRNKSVNDDSLSYVTSLSQSATGLPMTSWALMRGFYKGRCVIAVSKGRSKKIEDAILFSVGLEPKILGGGSLPKTYLPLVISFIQQNRKALHQHWRYEITSDQLCKLIKPSQP